MHKERYQRIKLIRVGWFIANQTNHPQYGPDYVSDIQDEHSSINEIETYYFGKSLERKKKRETSHRSSRAKILKLM